MSPLSQADIDNFFGTSSPRSRPRPRPRPRPSHSSPPPTSIVVHDSDDDIVALPSPPRTVPRPARPSLARKLARLDSEEASGEGSDSDIRDIHLSPERKAWRATTRRVVSDDDDDDAQPVRRKRKAAGSSDDDSNPPQRNGVTTRVRAHTGDQDSGGSGSEAPSPPRRLTRAQRRQYSDDSDSTSELPARRRRRSSAKRARLDPDEESNAAATADEAADEIELDEPERFVTATRLRERGETLQQRMLRKLKNRRLNLPSSDEEEEESESGGGAWEYVRDDDDGFISEDDGFDERLMPSEFSLGYAQSQEYKFKVMFQYLLLLVIHGPDVLPLRGAQKEYMAPVGELRAYVRGIRNLRVRSQIWRADFVKALETYPSFLVSYRAEVARYCHACNRRNQHCWQSVYLTGTRYDPQSHKELDAEDGGDDDEDEDDDDDDETGEEALPRDFDMGPHCLDSARLYHALSHWEHRLFRRIRGLYRELLRAKGVERDDSERDSGSDSDDVGFTTSAAERVAELRGTQLPDEHDVNAVLEWMETREYQNKAFEHFTGLEQKARMLGGDDKLREMGPDHT